MRTSRPTRDLDIAVIGMACRFPGADDVGQFRRNLEAGRDSITHLSAEELRHRGIDAQRAGPDFVAARGELAGKDEFDAEFFDTPAAEAAVMDPQHRLLLQCAWSALEQAGYARATGLNAGVYCGLGFNSYLQRVLTSKERAAVGNNKVLLANMPDHVSSRIAYKLGLEGPTVGVQTACSSSLVAIHLAVRALIGGECDLALAGGAAVEDGSPGYVFVKGGVLSPDGCCRPFDAKSQGTVRGSGAGVVILKRLADAIADGDPVHAIVRGSAVNNDGVPRIGYTAPRKDGQKKVILAAQAVAEVEPQDIGYIEAHGTATALGDAVEIGALKEVFGPCEGTVRRCAIGSVKSNFGHLDAAAGIAGFMKAVLSLQHRVYFPTVHFEKANPSLGLEQSPFFLSRELLPWASEGAPRMAAVSSFGMGGTNVHVVLEEAPEAVTTTSDRAQLLPLSGRTPEALDRQWAQLGAFAQGDGKGASLADIAYTLQTGRRDFPQRGFVVASSVAALASAKPTKASRAVPVDRPATVTFLFPGQGSQRIGMGRDLHAQGGAFRAAWDDCATVARDVAGIDLNGAVFGPNADAAALTETQLAQPALFAVEYALARHLQALGVRPTAMIGHSLGELVAAAVAGVMVPRDAMRLVLERSRLMQHAPRGSMLALPVAAATAEALAVEFGLGVAAYNGPEATVLSGPTEAVSRCEQALPARKLEGRRLQTSHAFHSHLMAEAADAFTAACRRIALQAPQLPFVSNLTGTWITAEQATDPAYWGRHLREAVRFDAGLETLLAAKPRVCLEVGPGRTLAGFALRKTRGRADSAVLAALPPPSGVADAKARAEETGWLDVLGRLWLEGIELDWNALHGAERPRRVALPTYPFARTRHWIDAAPPAVGAAPSIDEACFVPRWSEAAPTVASSVPTSRTWIVYADPGSVGESLLAASRGAGRRVLLVQSGGVFTAPHEDRAMVDPRNPEHWSKLAENVATAYPGPYALLCARSLQSLEPGCTADEDVVDGRGHTDVARFAQAMAQRSSEPLAVHLLTNRFFRVSPDEPVFRPERAALAGVLRALPAEYPSVRCRWLDVPWDTRNWTAAEAAALVAEIRDDGCDRVALRAGQRWQMRLKPVTAASRTASPALAPGGTYLITGGLGGIGREIAKFVARETRGTLVLVTRKAFPPESSWDAKLAELPADDAIRQAIIDICAMQAAGAKIEIETADLSEPRAAEALVARVAARHARIDGLIHSAGAPGGTLVRDSSASSARAVSAAKIFGARALLQLAPRCGARFVVLFSSLATEVGAPGQLDYTAANAYLDALAESSDASVRVASLAWDAWAESGMAARAHARSGHGAALPTRVAGLSNAEGVLAFHACLERNSRRFLVRKARGQSVPAAPTRPPAVAPIADVHGTVAGLLEKSLGRSDLDPDRNFFELGGDSMLAVHLAGEINRTFGLTVSVAVLFEFPTINQLAARIAQLIAPVAAPTPAAPPAARREDASGDIAIIGFSGRFPNSDHLDDFWRQLLRGEDLVTRAADPAPSSNAGGEALVRARSLVRQHIGDFDPAFFGYSPGEAELIDPQQRKLLECAWEAMEVAGYDVRTTPERIGLFAGAGVNSYYARMVQSAPSRLAEAGAAAGFANEKDSLATRIGYHLNLRGPCYSLQTYCSSSLAAVHVACLHLRTNQCEMALAGGVFLSDPDLPGYRYQPGGIFSSDGACRPFDAAAQGTVPADGAALVVLKRLDAAQRDGDVIHGVIKATASNNDGSAKVSYMAPGVQGQVAVLSSALAQSGLGPDEIDYIEAHGTGTALGDVAEISALKQVFGGRRNDAPRCLLGALKANIGHTDAAAGVMGLLKTMLVLKHRVVPPLAHFQTANPQLGLEQSPFAIPTTVTKVEPAGRPMRAGVSCFGIGGTNVHCILEEPPAPVPPTPPCGPQLFLLSGRTETAAAANAHALARWLAENPAASLADVAHTLALGRYAFPARIAIVAEDRADLQRQLAAVTTDTVQRVARPGKSAAGETAQPRLVGRETALDRAAIGAAWCRGRDWDRADAARLFPGHRIVLPTYRFDWTRHWVSTASRRPARAERQEPADWCHVPSWRKAAVAPLRAGTKTRWILAGTERPLLNALQNRLPAECFSVGDQPPADWPWPTRAEAGSCAEVGVVVIARRGAAADPWADCFGAVWGLSQWRELIGQARNAIVPVGITVVTQDVYDLPDEFGVGHAQAATFGLLRAAEWECGGQVSCRQVDVTAGDCAENRTERMAAQLARELLSSADEAAIALRGGGRWQRQIEPIRFEPAVVREGVDDGVCVIVGGTGNIGSIIAEAVVARGCRQLLILGREALDTNAATGNSHRPASVQTARKLRRLAALRALGATVDYAAVDVADPAALAGVFAEAERAGRTIRSVVHAAGLVGQEASAVVDDFTTARWRTVAAGKIDGLPALAAAIGARPLDFCLVVSSLSSVGGGYGFGLYAAAANVMDGFVARRNAEGAIPWIGLNLDTIADEASGSGRDPFAITAEELKQLVNTILAERVGGRIIVSTRPLEPVTRMMPRTVVAVKPAAQAAESPRREEAEETIARVWREALGLERIGSDENFFDLGGNSLLAIRVMSQLSRELGLTLALSDMFKSPTIAALAAAVRERQAPAGELVQGEL